MIGAINFYDKYTKKLQEWMGKFPVLYTFINMSLVLIQTGYILIRYKYLNSNIPFYYTYPWGPEQLGNKHLLFLVPAVTAFLTFMGIAFFYIAHKYFYLFADRVVLTTVTVSNVLLALSVVRIIRIAASPYEPLINPLVLELALPAFLAFLLIYLITPKFIDIFKEKNIITNPDLHSHPSMILSRPSARGGGLVFAIVFLIISLFFVFPTKEILGVYLAVVLLALLGILDDYQNTNSISKLRLLENPAVRLGSMFLIVLIPVLMGIQIETIGNPFNGILDFTTYKIVLLGTTFNWLSICITVVWIVWLLNVLSWSNGVDGQYGGIVGIALIVIAILALRYTPVSDAFYQAGLMAMIAAGASFGLSRYNWYPSRIMWGFGALSVGLVIATTSIMISGKIGVSIIIILVPFMDATVTFVRRIIQGRNPMRGDRGHLHHILMQRGWGVRRIASFYWLTTSIFGLFVIFTANRDVFLLTLTIVGLVAMIIIALNLSLKKEKTFPILDKLGDMITRLSKRIQQ